MRLYVDTTLKKALPSVSASGTDTKDEDRENLEYHNSYTKRPVGAASGHEASHDDPDVGGKHGGGDTVDEEVESKRQENNEKAAKRKLIPVEKGFATPEEMEKEDGYPEAFKSQSATNMLKSLTSGLAEFNQALLPSDLEFEFLTAYKGLPADEVAKGLHWIAGKDRDLFQEWVCDRMQKSITSLLRSVT